MVVVSREKVNWFFSWLVKARDGSLPKSAVGLGFSGEIFLKTENPVFQKMLPRISIISEIAR